MKLKYPSLEDIERESCQMQELLMKIPDLQANGALKKNSFHSLLYGIAEDKKLCEKSRYILNNLPKDHLYYEVLKSYYEYSIVVSDFIVEYYEKELLERSESN